MKHAESPKNPEFVCDAAAEALLKIGEGLGKIGDPKAVEVLSALMKYGYWQGKAAFVKYIM